MSGYNGFSKSNNACDAESNGRFPASIIAKKIGRGVTADFIVKYCGFAARGEFHHTSLYCNRTAYFDLEDIQAWVDGDDGDEWPADRKRFDVALSEWRIARAKPTTIHEDVVVTWLEWSGTRSHPTATTCKAEGCRIEDDGRQFVTVHLADGFTFRKKRQTRGFEVHTCKGDRVLL